MRRKISPRLALVIAAAIFGLTTLLVYWYFIAYGKSFVWNYDGVDQHYPALYYFNRWIRAFLHNPGAGLPLWSFEIGMGADIISTLSFYVVGDPFALVSLAFPRAYMETAYAVTLMLRIACTGAVSWVYLRHMGAKRLPALIGTILYSFSAMTLYTASLHPFFVNAMVFLPLMLLGFEAALHRRRSWLLSIAVFLAAVGNFYFFYILTLVTVIYAVARYFELTPKEDRWRKLAPTAFRLAGYFALGAVIAAPILLPTAIAITQSARGHAEYDLNLLYTLREYRSTLLALVSSDKSTNYSFMTFSIVGFMLAPLLFLRKKQHSALKFMLVAYVLFVTLPIFGSMFNGFTFPNNRFAFSWGIFLALATSLLLSEKNPLSRRDLKYMAGGYCAYALTVLLIGQPLSKQVLATLGVGAAFLALCAIGILQPMKRITFQAAILGLLIFSIVVNAAFFFNIRYTPSLHDYVDSGKVLKFYRSTAGGLARQLPKDHFYRVENTDPPNYNSALVQGFNGTSYYYSLMSAGLTEFKTELGINAERLPSFSFAGFNSRAVPTALVGTEYYLSRATKAGAAPFGFSTFLDKGKLVALRSPYALPLGFVYPTVMNRSVYDKLTSLEKQSVLLKSAVIDDAAAKSLPRSTAASSPIELPVSLISTRSAVYDVAGKTILRTSPDNQILLGVPKVPGAEVYVELRKFQNALMTPMEWLYFKKGDKANGAQKASAQSVMETFIRPWRLATWYSAGGTKREVVWHPRESPYHWGEDTQLVNLGYQRSGIATVAISWEGVGTTKFESLKVFAVPMADFPAEIAKLKTSPLRDVRMGSNSVSGKVSTTSGGLLFLSIPYNPGWSATVDGRPATIVPANTAFSGIQVPAGDHQIELRYMTPGLKPGLALAGVALVTLLALIGVSEWRRRKRKTAAKQASRSTASGR